MAKVTVTVFALELLQGDRQSRTRREFVESYSNRHGAPRSTSVEGQAKTFSSKDEAEGWAQQYIPGYQYQAVELQLTVDR